MTKMITKKIPTLLAMLLLLVLVTMVTEVEDKEQRVISIDQYIFNSLKTSEATDPRQDATIATEATTTDTAITDTTTTDTTTTDTTTTTTVCPTLDYFFLDTPKTHDQAATHCTENGGTLAEFRTVDEINAFKSAFQLCAQPTADYWLGIKQASTLLNYKWMDDSPVTVGLPPYFSWQDTSDSTMGWATFDTPGGGTTRLQTFISAPDVEECLYINDVVNFYVNDRQCDRLLLAACKRNTGGR